LVDKVRTESIPCFIELTTYRWREHCGPHFDNDLGYRRVEEYEDWAKKDSILAHRRMLKEQFKVADPILFEMESKIRYEIQVAFEYAENSRFPDQVEGLSGEYISNLVEDRALCEV